MATRGFSGTAVDWVVPAAYCSASEVCCEACGAVPSCDLACDSIMASRLSIWVFKVLTSSFTSWSSDFDAVASGAWLACAVAPAASELAPAPSGNAKMLPLKFNKSTNAMIARKISDRKNLRPFLLRLKESDKKRTARYCPGISTLAFCVFRAFAVAAAGAHSYLDFDSYLQLVCK